MMFGIAEPKAKNRLTDQDWQASNITGVLPKWATLTDGPPRPREFRLPFDGGELVVSLDGDQPAWLGSTVQSLGKLLQLRANWDTYGGSPVDPQCIVAALDILVNVLPDDAPEPSVVPTSRGAVQLEWHTRGVDLEVELLSATRVCGLFEDAVTGLSWEKDLSFDLSPLVDAISRLSQRQ